MFAKIFKTAALLIMCLAVALLAIAIFPTVFRMPRTTTILSICAIGVGSAGVLWYEFKAIGKWITQSKANEKRKKVLSGKDALTLVLLFTFYEAALVSLLAGTLSIKGSSLVLLMLLPSLETPFAIPLWIGAAIFVKQLAAKA